MIVSFDCLLEITRLDYFGNSEYIYKSVLSICFMGFLLMILTLISLLIKFIMGIRIRIRWIVFISLVTIVGVQYSSLSSTVLNFFNCLKIGNNIRLVKDLETICWTRNHIYWTISIGVPGIVIFLIMPVFGIALLVIKWR